MSEKKLAAPVEAVADAPAAEPKKKAAKPAARRGRPTLSPEVYV